MLPGLGRSTRVEAGAAEADLHVGVVRRAQRALGEHRAGVGGRSGRLERVAQRMQQPRVVGSAGERLSGDALRFVETALAGERLRQANGSHRVGRACGPCRAIASFRQRERARSQCQIAESRRRRRAFRVSRERRLDGRGGGDAIAAREIEPPKRDADFIDRQRLLPRRGQRLLEAIASTRVRSRGKLVLGNPEQRAGMLRQRHENLLVDRARRVDAAGRLVARREREGILQRQLHGREPRLAPAVPGPWASAR